MKKVMLGLAALAMVVCFASCKKTCTCTTYATTQEYTLEELQNAYGADNIKSCDDVTTYTLNIMKCE